jgi:hypothetical protein
MTNDTEAGARIVGTLRAEAGKGVVRMEDCYETEMEGPMVSCHRPLAAGALGR